MMKRFIVNIMFITLISLGLIVSCSSDINKNEPLAFVSFGGSVKSISSSNPDLPLSDNLIWKYSATKKDFGLTTGETANESNVNGSTTGLGSNRLGPFSVGKWEFTLSGYDDSGSQIYTGKTEVSLEANTITQISVPIQYVAPTNVVNGSYKLDNVTFNGAIKVEVIATRVDGSNSTSISKNFDLTNSSISTTVNEIPAGIYKFDFNAKDFNEIVVSHSSLYALIMEGLTTVFTGSVEVANTGV